MLTLSPSLMTSPNIIPRFYVYYMISGKTLVGPKLDNDKYPSVKPFTWEDFMKQMSVPQQSG